MAKAKDKAKPKAKGPVGADTNPEWARVAAALGRAEPDHVATYRGPFGIEIVTEVRTALVTGGTLVHVVRKGPRNESSAMTFVPSSLFKV